MTRTIRFLLPLLLLAGSLTPAEPATTPEPFFTPKQDLDGLKPNTDLKTGLPNVLLIGDSISIGYTKTVMERLNGVANVQRPKANCGDTGTGLANLKTWLGTTKWDVIHFNWGLWDLCYRHPQSKVQGNRDKVNGKLTTSLEQYEQNLEQLVQQLKATGAKLIWAATTVVPEDEAGRFAGDDSKYNEVARRVMAKHGIPVNDLHTLTAGFKGQYSTGKDDVHFTKDGYAKIGEQVAAAITPLLNKSEPAK